MCTWCRAAGLSGDTVPSTSLWLQRLAPPLHNPQRRLSSPASGARLGWCRRDLAPPSTTRCELETRDELMKADVLWSKPWETVSSFFRPQARALGPTSTRPHRRDLAPACP